MRATPCVTLWRLVLEAQTPLSIATGRGDGERDTVLATDANGLPFIPATSMAGVLRALVRSAEPALENSLFGHLAPNSTELGSMSRMEISHAHIHDSQDQPVTGLRLGGIDDELLKPLLHRRNAQRQRVRINHRGTADDTGLFDRSVLPAGHRFTVEWALWSLQAAPAEAALLERLLRDGWLRLGGLTRNGLGQLRCVRGQLRAFDLRSPADLKAYCALPADLAADASSILTTRWQQNARPASAVSLGALRKLTLTLTAESGFRLGGGTQSLLPSQEGKPNADWAISEARVQWSRKAGHTSQEHGRLNPQPEALVPATGIKGALAHRVAFHANRLAGVWATTKSVNGYDKALHCDTVRRLFGTAGNEREASAERPPGNPAAAGVLGFADQWLVVRPPRENSSAQAPASPAAVTAQVRMHNHIDRFTGGVRDGLLFGTEDLYPVRPQEPVFTLDITLDEARLRRRGGTPQDLQALACAVQDLCEGRLALGADSAGGLGFFHGKAQWGDGATWESLQAQLAAPATDNTQPSNAAATTDPTGQAPEHAHG